MSRVGLKAAIVRWRISEGKGGCYMKLANAKGEMVYFNLVQKNGKLQWVIKGIGDTVVLGRDRQKKKSRTFTQEAQADAY
jgi:hypothetical protein|nr:MAG TPA: hypothetical protein [Caudoviricetes sp.]